MKSVRRTNAHSIALARHPHNITLARESSQQKPTTAAAAPAAKAPRPAAAPKLKKVLCTLACCAIARFRSHGVVRCLCISTLARMTHDYFIRVH